MLPLLDIRESADYQAGHPSGSANIPLSEISSRMYELPEKGSALAVFDSDAARREQALALLQERGYRVEIVPDLPLTETGPARHRLWRPTPLLEEALRFTPSPGRALDLACGSGREAVYLASLGWQVTGIDILPDALANAASLAARNNVRLNLVQRDLRKEALPSDGVYGLITLFRFWHEPLVESAIARLAPSGLLAIEAFAPTDQQIRRSENAVSGDHLAGVAKGLDVLICREQMRNGRSFTQLVALRK